MSVTSRARPPVKGVGFSDHPTVLGPSPSSVSQTYIAPRSQNPPSEKPRSTSLDLPSIRRSPGKRHARFFETSPQLISDSPSTPLRPYSESLETSCTDSEDDHASISPHHSRTDPFHAKPSYDIEESTRINTKLNSLPSGGEFSLMNSSEDVYSSSSDDEQHLSSSRRLVRVPGSAKLSTASGLADDSDLDEEDEFAIEGAEEVDEEEAVNVRSFGRSFARVCLKEDPELIHPNKPTKWEKHKSQVSFDVPDGDTNQHHQSHDEASASDSASAASAPTTQKKPSQTELPGCKSAPPSRKSRLRLTFVRRPSAADIRQPKPGMGARAATSVNVCKDDADSMTRLSCFPIRRAPSRLRTRSGDIRSGLLHRTRTGRDESTKNATAANTEPNQILAVPEFTIDERSNRTKKNPKMPENISMQRDDWIDFATNTPHRQRSQWLSRFISHNAADSEASSVRDSQTLASNTLRQSRSSGWKVWRLLSRKSLQA